MHMVDMGTALSGPQGLLLSPYGRRCVMHNNNQTHLSPETITFNKIQDVLKQLKEAGFDTPLAVPNHRDILLVLGGKVTDVDDFLRSCFLLAS